jgi:NAD+ kinase
VLLVTHTGRADVVRAVRLAAGRLLAADIAVRMLAGEAGELDLAEVQAVAADRAAADGCELVVVFGGDGTFLRAAEYGRESRTPVLGINLGHVGFLAEVERDSINATIDRIVACDYTIEERMTLDIRVSVAGVEIARDWALNEVAIEKSRQRMLELMAEVDGRPLSRWGCDGVLFATPTGSTAYAFSAGGPVVWPSVEALLLVPITAHALFARPLVVAPTSVLAVELLPDNAGGAVLSSDGRRTLDLPAQARVQACRGDRPVLLARLHSGPFTDRLVAKFGLPVGGWRARSIDTGED